MSATQVTGYAVLFIVSAHTPVLRCDSQYKELFRMAGLELLAEKVPQSPDPLGLEKTGLSCLVSDKRDHKIISANFDTKAGRCVWSWVSSQNILCVITVGPVQPIVGYFGPFGGALFSTSDHFLVAVWSHVLCRPLV